MSTQTVPVTSQPRARAARGWPAVTTLVALSAIPVTVGSLRLIQMAGGPDLLPVDGRLSAQPVALAAHIVGSAIFALAGALQFASRFRRRHPAWHRRTGRVLVVAGLVVAVSALWLTLFAAPKPGTGAVLFVARLGFGTALAASIMLGFAAIRRRDCRAHAAWMIRAYAIALAAGTQPITEALGAALFGTGVLAADLAKTAAWFANLAVAEWIIRRSRRPRARRS